MSLEALLIVLMAGTEIFRPLRELRTVLHQGMVGQSAAAGIYALLDEPITAPGAPDRRERCPRPRAAERSRRCAPTASPSRRALRLSRRPARRA